MKHPLVAVGTRSKQGGSHNHQLMTGKSARDMNSMSGYGRNGKERERRVIVTDRRKELKKTRHS